MAQFIGPDRNSYKGFGSSPCTTDSYNRPLSNLTAESLIITDRKTRVADFRLLHSPELPLDLGILIDTSNSQRGTNLPDALKAAKDFVNSVIRPQNDRVFFITFSESLETTPWLQKQDLAAISLNVKIGGGTALFDSIAAACKDRMESPAGRRGVRRVLVSITDGEDNSSRITLSQAQSEALKAGVVIFAIGTDESPLQRSGRLTRVFGGTTELTGGEFFAGLKRSDMEKAFATIQALMDGSYYASYLPPQITEQIHELDIRPSSKEKFRVYYPSKYVWASQ